MSEFVGIDQKIEDEKSKEVEPTPSINVENVGYQSLSVDMGELSKIMLSWGFSNKEISEFKITFRPAIVDNPKFHKKLVQGYYQKQPDGSGLIEVYTTIPVQNSSDQDCGVAVKESVLQWVLAHEMRHAMQDRVGELEKHTVVEGPGDAYDASPLEQDAEAYAKDNFEKFKDILSCTDAPKNAGEIGEEEIAEEDPMIQEGLNTEKTYLMNESDHPAKTWEGDVDKIYDAFKKGEIDAQSAKDQYIEIVKRGWNMTEAGSRDQNKVATLGSYEFELKVKEMSEKFEDTEDEILQSEN